CATVRAFANVKSSAIMPRQPAGPNLIEEMKGQYKRSGGREEKGRIGPQEQGFCLSNPEIFAKCFSSVSSSGVRPCSFLTQVFAPADRRMVTISALFSSTAVISGLAPTSVPVEFPYKS